VRHDDAGHLVARQVRRAAHGELAPHAWLMSLLSTWATARLERAPASGRHRPHEQRHSPSCAGGVADVVRSLAEVPAIVPPVPTRSTNESMFCIFF
jgi:hypothetical protein